MKQGYGSEGHAYYFNANHKTQLFSLKRRRTKWQKNTQTPEKTIHLILHGIRLVFEHLQPLKSRATRSAGKPVSILRDTAKTCRSFW